MEQINWNSVLDLACVRSKVLGWCFSTFVLNLLDWKVVFRSLRQMGWQFGGALCFGREPEPGLSVSWVWQEWTTPRVCPRSRTMSRSKVSKSTKRKVSLLASSHVRSVPAPLQQRKHQAATDDARVHLGCVRTTISGTIRGRKREGTLFFSRLRRKAKTD